MHLLLDHLFILTDPGAPVADRLVESGFVEGSSNTHPGQGTANRRFFFSDFTLELLYISDKDEAAHGAGKNLRLLERCNDAEASPFGLVVRVADVETAPDFPAWQYTPDYFGGSMHFYVGENSKQLTEPLCVCMPPAIPPRKNYTENRHWKFNGLELTVPTEIPSTVLQQFADIDKVHIEYGKIHKAKIKFNNETANKTIDLFPELPLIISH